MSSAKITRQDKGKQTFKYCCLNCKEAEDTIKYKIE